MQIFKGTVITAQKDGIVKYLVEDMGRIAFAGDELPEKYSGAPVVDLGEKALMPAFADTHAHFASYALLSSTVKLGGAKSNAEILELLKKADAERPAGKGLLCFGASPKVEEGRLIEKDEIDSAVSGRAVAIICGDGHTAVLNGKALAKMPKSLAATRGCDTATGIMHQEAFYKAAGNFIKIIDIKAALKSFQDSLDKLAERGVGLLCAECGQSIPLDLDVELLKWIFRGQISGMQFRLFVQSFDVRKAKRRGLPRLGGCFDTALDGSITSRDAAMLEPYEGTDEKGILYNTDEELFKKLDKINRAGLQIQMHAIGDAAVEQGATALKRALDAYPRKDHRHGLIHVSLISGNAMRILKDYGIQVIGQPAFIEYSEENFEFMKSALGEKRVFAAEPHSEFVKQGINFSASSDAPVTDPDPIKWIYYMVNNPNTAHRLSLDDAIRACTINGYYSTFDDAERGSLEEGKIADMVVLSRNPYAVAPEDIKDIRVEETYFAGKRFERKNGKIFSTIVRGMFRPNVKL